MARRKARKKRYGRCSELDRATPRVRLNQKRDHAQVSHGRLAEVREQRLDAIRAWTRARGRVALTLWVHERNVRARRAYARLGFVETGAREPFAPDPRADELEMRS